MTKKDLILIGAGGHARSCIDVIEQEGKFKITGLVGLENELGSQVNGYEVIATEECLSTLIGKAQFALIAVGQISSPDTRVNLFQRALKAGFELASISSPSAYVSPSAQIGKGTIVMHGAIINTGVKVGSNCIINSRVLLEHETQVLDNCHISTGAILNGGVFVKEGCFIGSGSLIKEGISIGERSIVGMGSVLRADLNDNSKFLGDSFK
jgi:sugar O-acyltransferase (sialic acid O-acetyltransferase NeuD family)